MNEEQKQQMVKQRLQQYEQQIFSLEMDKVALVAVEDTEGVKNIDIRIEAVRKAHSAVAGMV
ncbi:hypothetical protein [Paenibacillus sp. UASWS1643]|uniref:hypothetical protein n=1 Tax=Paenibacillus sp. UASWS1643 TaxID=2580422 RepID=UPI0012394079|nr:hypothetical protein [Paenibacillus sp. UASWS1643]KAA8747101.1 hypothetical protein FE296_23225 [Paenibacillus sp. UASWS1643]